MFDRFLALVMVASMHDRHPASCCRMKIAPLLQGVSFRCFSTAAGSSGCLNS